MRNLNPADYSQSERQSIMKALIDAEAELYTQNLWHRDIHLRNILVLDSPVATPTRRVVLIDFGNSWFTRTHPMLPPELAKKFLLSAPISPLLRWSTAWWDYLQIGFEKWIDWD